MAFARYSGMTPVAATTVSVFAQGTQNLVDLFEDIGGLVPLANPFTSDTVTGAYTFVTEAALLDVVLGAPSTVPLTPEPLDPQVIFSGTTPDRHAVLFIRDPDTWQQIILADIVY